MFTIGTRVRIRRTGDAAIDRYAGQLGHIEDTREINDGGYRYIQVAVSTDAGALVWVNDNEVEAA